MSVVVMKFGGTSIADADKISRAANRAIKAHKTGQQVVMVVSAMGKSTDRLIDLARQITPNPPRREMDQLLATGDPRATGGGDEFDVVPYLGYGPRHPSYKPGEE